MGEQGSGRLGQAHARDPSHQLRVAERIWMVLVSTQTAFCGQSYDRKPVAEACSLLPH